jgi:lysophospholipase L1-like esterase
MPESPSSVVIPAKPIPFRHPMTRLRERLAGTGSIKIAALGSSTTAGEGGIVPYPQRLETFLRTNNDPKFKGRNFDVLNRGIGSQEAPDERDRMQQDVIVEHPDVVIWQVGTNSAFKNNPTPDVTAKAIREGLAMLATTSADIILMDPQYVPALVLPDNIERARTMVRLIDEAAAGATMPVNIFKRFDFMQQWYDVEKISFDRIVDPGDTDRLHHSDWSVIRLAWTLADLMVKATVAGPTA